MVVICNKKLCNTYTNVYWGILHNQPGKCFMQLLGCTGKIKSTKWLRQKDFRSFSYLHRWVCQNRCWTSKKWVNISVMWKKSKRDTNITLHWSLYTYNKKEARKTYTVSHDSHIIALIRLAFFFLPVLCMYSASRISDYNHRGRAVGLAFWSHRPFSSAIL